MTANSKTRITFAHPRDSRTFPVDVGPALTGEKAIEELVKQKFIEAPDKSRGYALALVRTGKQLPMSQALGDVGLQDGDTIAISESNAGARS